MVKRKTPLSFKGVFQTKTDRFIPTYSTLQSVSLLDRYDKMIKNSTAFLLAVFRQMSVPTIARTLANAIYCLIIPNISETVSKGRLSSRKIQYIVLRKCFARIYSDKKGCPVTFGTPSFFIKKI